MSAESEKKNIVCIGGGTGTHTVLTGLKQYQKQLNLAAVVTMADNGGSTGRLRDEFGQLPVGDVRMALTALSRDIDEHEELLRELFLYRFDRGDGLVGHNFGNLLLVALTDILGSEEAAIRTAAKVLRVEGRVLPVTNQPVDLVATYSDGVTVVGEHDIDEPTPDRATHRIESLAVHPPVAIAERAEQAILQADMIVLGPGDLYTSVLANVVVPGVAEAIQNSGAQVVYVSNLMTKLGQTSGFGLEKHVTELTAYLGIAPTTVLVNKAELPPDLLGTYAEEHEHPVVTDYCGDEGTAVHSLDLLATDGVVLQDGDRLKRSLLRHDSQKLARALVNLIE